ncbi:MAG: spermidine synthase [Thermoprotei archaeon]|nr:MAG: spermidine synthase [Thermoprotei archaeon]RLE81201.1 MAG: spermidine synthase [Thermoprotei archaeon]RLF00129.1 MAG: spermidine synthase [Thermoprotei archaeon]
MEAKWRCIIEWITPEDAHIWYIRDVIYQGETRFQRVDIVETRFGKHIFLDGKTQSTQSDEYIYHEALVHPVMFSHPNPQNVLIIGGGEGATLREVLKHRKVVQAIMVDIDRELVDLCQKFLKEWHQGSFQDPRAELIFTDGRNFVEKCDAETFDVVILDLTDPTREGPAYKLYTKEFYELIYNVLKPDGIMVTQATSTYYNIEVFSSIFNTISAVFPVTRAYKAFIPSFLSDWGFVIGSKKYDPLKVNQEALKYSIQNDLKAPLRYYDSNLHFSLFAISKNVKEQMSKVGRISTDREPVYIAI